MADLFAYGELLKKSTLLELLGRVPPSVPATLRGYRRVLDPEIGYYVAVRDDESRMEGKVLKGIKEDELSRLDEYEGVDRGLYKRIRERVKIGGQELQVFLYGK